MIDFLREVYYLFKYRDCVNITIHIKPKTKDFDETLLLEDILKLLNDKYPDISEEE